MQTRLIFPASKIAIDHPFDAHLGGQEVWINSSNDNRINGLLFSQSSEKVVLYFHGNGGNLNGWQYVNEDFRFLGFDALVIDYQGYGKSDGEPSEANCYADANAAYDYLVSKGYKAENIILYGRSIGTGVAVELASTRQCHSVILESPYTSVTKLVQQRTFYLFPPLLVKHKFKSIDKIGKLNKPLLIIHGAKDFVIPIAHGRKLFDAYDGPKQFVELPEADHNNCRLFEEYKKGLTEFYLNYK